MAILTYDLKVSNKEIAQAVGVSEKTVSLLINGKQMVSVEVLVRIVDYLNERLSDGNLPQGEIQRVTIDELVKSKGRE